VGRYVGGLIANGILRLASVNMTLTSFFVSSAVNPSIICQDPTGSWAANSQPCINLLGIIGGTSQNGSDGGIIGRLYSGLYQGLIIMVMAFVGIWLLWTGIAKRKIREAFSGLVWALLLFAGGVIMLNNPLLLAQAPMRIGTAIGACAVEGINGINCFNPSGSSLNNSSGGATEGSECYLDVSGADNISDQLSISSKMATCTLWKAFVLQPWSLGQFGTTYDNLYTGGLNSQEGNYLKAFKDQSSVNYWKNISVSMYSSTGDASTTCLATDSKWRYSNIALYQLSLQTLMHDCNGAAKNIAYHDTSKVYGTNDTYADWYYLVDLMASAKATAGAADPANDVAYTWWYWYGGYSSTRIGIAMIALFASFLGGFVLSVTALFGLMYMFSGVLLMAFAPIFLLFGIVPGQGKKIFLGWVEQVLSAILKYFASILWLLIGVQLYSAVLGSANNLGTSFLFVIIVTMVVWMYRREFINLIGRASLGGQQMSNKLGDYMSNKAKSAKRLAVANVGGYAGGFVAGNDNVRKYDGSDGFKGRVKNTLGNLKERGTAANDTRRWSNTQQLKRGNGIISNAARSSDAVQDARRKKALQDTEATKRTLDAAKGDLSKRLNLTEAEALAMDVDSLRNGSESEFLEKTASERALLSSTDKSMNQINAHKSKLNELLENGVDHTEVAIPLGQGKTQKISGDDAKAYLDYKKNQELLRMEKTSKNKTLDAARLQEIQKSMNDSRETYSIVNDLVNESNASNEKEALAGSNYASKDDLMKARDAATSSITAAQSDRDADLRKFEEIKKYKKVISVSQAADLNNNRLETNRRAEKLDMNDIDTIRQAKDSVQDVIDSKGNINDEALDKLGLDVGSTSKTRRKRRKLTRNNNKLGPGNN
jgi:hypothetical protein